MPKNNQIGKDIKPIIEETFDDYKDSSITKTLRNGTHKHA